MNLEEINVLRDWVAQQSEFNKNDLLVTINAAKIIPFSNILELGLVQKTIIKSQISIKESGINPFCTTSGLLNWSYQSTEISTPIFIIPTNFKVDKVRKLVELFPIEEDKIINPFLVKKLAQLFQLEIPTSLQEQELFQFLNQQGFNSIEVDKSFVGNFHHHRFAVLKDLESIIEKNELSENLLHYISGTKPTTEIIKFPTQAILNYDSDHRAAFQIVEQENCVIQGPPGTGKSQLLTNLVAKSLACQKSQLVVSEKKSALEVIQKRLAARNLDTFSIVVNDGISSHEFIESLKNTWEMLDHYHSPKNNELSIFKELSDNLQLTLDILGQPTLIGGLNYTQFEQIKSEIDLSNFKYLSEVPLLPDYQETLQNVEQLYKSELQPAISKLGFKNLQKDQLTTLDEKLDELRVLCNQLTEIESPLTPAILEKIQFKAVVLQLFENEIARKYLEILRPNSKQQIQFKKQFEKYHELRGKVELRRQDLSHWYKLPSKIESETLLEQFELSSLFKRIKRNKRWKQLSVLPLTKATDALKDLIEFRKLEEKLNQIEYKLKSLGIEDLTEITQINASIGLFSADKWLIYEEISSATKNNIRSFTSNLSAVKTLLKQEFRLDLNIPIIQQLDEIEKSLPQLISFASELQTISKEVYKAISTSTDFNAYKQNVIGTHQSNFAAHYPNYSNFKLADFKLKLERILVEENTDQKLFAQKIWDKIKSEFDSYHQLLNTPTSKLNEEDKQLKGQLKRGKSILIKEFSKSKQHPTIREFLASDAGIWIRLLKPIWLTNPVQLAKTHNVDCEPFDLCIIDEASQILVENAVGSIQRSKRIVIAGDQQQMRPSAYFQGGTKDVISVLQHASYQFKNIHLRHHYRSKHAPLIAFSNTHFYNEELEVFPSYPILKNCITRYYCEEGRFIDRKNSIEAKEVSTLIANALKQSKTIGVIAFSQEQLDEIWNTLEPITRHQLTDLIEGNKAFFKPLEKVQGDECEHLIISLAYGKDENEQFQQRFGPLNQDSGRNRLNVLFSRASEKIDFVCSIESKDLKWSSNANIELLYKWLVQLEIESHDSKAISLPKNIEIHNVSNKMTLTDVLFQYKDALELKTKYEVFKSRGWEIEFK